MNKSFIRFFSKVVNSEVKSFKFTDISVRLASPERLQPKPEAKALLFGKHFTDHMLKIEYHVRAGGWQAPIICPMEYISLHPAAKVLHYAVELFEGMKAFRGKDGKIRIFRPELNMARMNLSASRSCLPQFDAEEMIKCLCRLISIDQEWVPHSEAASLYIRPTLVGTEPSLGVASSESALLYTILCPVGPYFATSSDAEAVSLMADPNFIRAWPGGVGDRKMGANYAPTIKIQEQAHKKGYQQVLWLYGEDHQLTEAGTMNIFVVIKNRKGEKELITAPLNGLILPGITRQSIIQLAKEWREFAVTERVVTMPELLQLTKEKRLLEVFGSGTACVVTPVKRIFYEDVALEIPTMEQDEPIYKKMSKTITDIQYGEIEHPWARPID
ncbi:branched-chain-amino-acid aminotransferase [Halyomorpha halys]|uniref:branched-chain-amino-acid aminotransferase n=1 Tax=Halyomorpha halys TaxID=286706 RepID=UPI0006D4DA96|nr:branched-chain-amino-acid aminotransferase [Halyomorpha halys]XP_014293191.1 branched-chain-amino-acid aminotransferase [Halyomorpha halys]